ncbi:hypothetical protein PILCRDRAFT_1326 [Piloderma croceum F 1598]|uniref:Uncharacterized protein n=1 Tax=Piloderma croceum (strain F 1598) TaxID=765440 RepID=A0A0C3BX99_PILCF|nr:hypothetical protein PILCRDRAFT_1326 [Piloderma croceum F 1598]
MSDEPFLHGREVDDLQDDGRSPKSQRVQELASKVMSLADTGCLVLEHLPFKDLINYSQTGSSPCQLVKTALRLRFKSLVRPYVGVDVLTFRSLVLNVGAVIAGSSVTWMLSPWGWNPNNLNMIMPRGKVERITAYFTNLGYSQSSIDIDNVALLAVYHVFHLRRAKDLVIIVKSKNVHVIHPVTCTLNSAQMNIMTPDKIIIFYPEMTLENMCIIGRRCYPSNQHCRKIPDDFRIIDSHDFNRHCGRNCPTLY